MNRSLPGFNRRLRHTVNKRSSGRGGRPMMGMRVGHRFNPTTKSSWIRLIAEEHTSYDGSFVPYFEYTEHFAKTRTNKGFICSRTWEEDFKGDLKSNGNCIGCLELGIPQGSGEKARDAARDVSIRRMSAFLALHLADYHDVEAHDDRGRPLTYREENKWHKKGDPIMRRVECTGRGCRECLARRPKVFGKLVHWSVGGGHLGQISAFADSLEMKCKNCNGKLEAVMFCCPACNEILLDLTDSRNDTMTDEDILAVVGKPVNCRHCRHLDFPKPLFECDSCQNPRSTSLFDVSFCIKKTSDQIPKLFFEDHRLEDIPKDLAAMLPVDKDGNPRNILHRIFTPDDMRRQCDVLQVRNPFGDDPSQERYTGYDDPGADEGDDLDVH